jgi:hypothetical protein
LRFIRKNAISAAATAAIPPTIPPISPALAPLLSAFPLPWLLSPPSGGAGTTAVAAMLASAVFAADCAGVAGGTGDWAAAA